MRNSTLAAVLVVAATPAFAQNWELGAGAGAGIYSSNQITAGGQTATAGIEKAIAVSAYVGQNLYRNWAGEIRYTWQPGRLRLETGSGRATFDAHSHAIHYDVLYQFRTQEDTLRPFFAVGGGAKYFQGTGDEVVFQPLSQFGYLTRTAEWQPMLSIGGGVKYKLSRRLILRAEMRDYVTPFPKKVIAPALGASSGGLLHDFLVFGTLSVLF